MPKNYPALIGDLSKTIGTLRKDIPEVMQGFGALNKAATADGTLDHKTKELLALAIAVAGRCQGCIGFHSKALVGAGASRQEVLETLGVAVYMGGGPALMYAAEAIDAYDQFASERL